MESLTRSPLLEWPPNTVQKIRKLYNLDKHGRIEEAVNILQEWIEKQDHIVKKDFDRAYLERTIILSKGSVEKAKKQIDKLCTMKTLLPKFFTKTNAKVEFKDLLTLGCMIPLPVMTKDLYRIILMKNTNDLEEENFLEFYQYSIILSEYLRANEYAAGMILLCDCRESNILNVVTKMNTVEFQQFSTIFTEGYGGRVKGIHILTTSKAIEVLVKLVSPFMNQKIVNRIHIHKTLEDLHAIVPKDLLPAEYGGKQKSFDKLNSEWMDELSRDEHVQYMKMINKACTNEALRRTDKFNEEYMGMPGSFRQLSVD